METTLPRLSLEEKLAQKLPVIVSGPCSAETEAQVMETCTRLAATGKVDVLRAGIWKPRTKPGSFEGVGTMGLTWLMKAKAETGLLTTVEVATTKHVEDALHFGVDILWIGARTTVNPFSVQEIAQALRGVDTTIWIKNPINPDLELWVGAVERIKKAGIKKLGLIHRGFSNYGNTEFRNAPMWHLPIELRRRMPEIPMLCDPSHICGRRDILGEISQKAIDLGYNGLMLETHCDPDNAWSDAKQQITPEKLAELLDKIVWRHQTTDQQDFLTVLEKLRQQINHIDDELLQLLGNRMKVAEKIGEYKRENDITILQTNR
ncbi:MAG TPA: chorismate mutase, partial [Chitinophagaceae bacterium]|nr:chorismate mutase [Chitinophagaceae bacterium]